MSTGLQLIAVGKGVGVGQAAFGLLNNDLTVIFLNSVPF